ncbi:hypothetical protein D5b_00166 [Faustovirus]|nr:hypothetical protein D5b_00166 [Faustovirus]
MSNTNDQTSMEHEQALKMLCVKYNATAALDDQITELKEVNSGVYKDQKGITYHIKTDTMDLVKVLDDVQDRNLSMPGAIQGANRNTEHLGVGSLFTMQQPPTHDRVKMPDATINVMHFKTRISELETQVAELQMMNSEKENALLRETEAHKMTKNNLDRHISLCNDIQNKYDELMAKYIHDVGNFESQIAKLRDDNTKLADKLDSVNQLATTSKTHAIMPVQLPNTTIAKNSQFDEETIMNMRKALNLPAPTRGEKAPTVYNFNAPITVQQITVSADKSLTQSNIGDAVYKLASEFNKNTTNRVSTSECWVDGYGRSIHNPKYYFNIPVGVEVHAPNILAEVLGERPAKYMDSPLEYYRYYLNKGCTPRPGKNFNDDYEY